MQISITLFSATLLIINWGTLIFGFIHGTGLATKILDYEIADDGLLLNLIALNLGVEIGDIVSVRLKG